jgi:Predicted sugar phosphate isomerase
MTPAAKSGTESANPYAVSIDDLAEAEAADAMVASHLAAAAAVKPHAAAITEASALVAAALSGKGRVHYCGAGSSGLMAMADALELPGTFGIGRDRIAIHLAEGVETIHRFDSANEDFVERARAAFANGHVGPDDCFILVAASGSTPFVVAMAESAVASGASTIAIVNNRNTPLSKICRLTIALDTGAEVVAGSTRLGAGTAQKIVLNAISTQAGIRLGHVYKGRMVNFVIANSKLRNRAIGVVSDISGLTESQSAECVDRAEGSVKTALMLAFGAPDVKTAERLVADANGRLDAAIASLAERRRSTA